MAVASLHRCATADLTVNLITPRLEELKELGDAEDQRALRAEFGDAEPAA
ncbi:MULTISPECIES: hypothetical protein [unclassified Cyanobium]|nr:MULTISPECIES: hypothetical protein [unclassified Cyanobium]